MELDYKKTLAEGSVIGKISTLWHIKGIIDAELEEALQALKKADEVMWKALKNPPKR